MADVAYRVSNFMMKVVLRAFSTWRVEGLENVPPHGPLLVVANHLSNLDPPLLACSLPRRLYYLAKRGIFKPVVGTFLKNYGAYPLDLNATDMRAFLWARKRLADDGALAIFPETHRNPREGMHKPNPGVALLALRTRALILPVGITGSESVGPPWQIAFPTGDITVHIGQPFSLPVIEGKIARPQLEELADTIMYRVALLLPRRYQGIYRPREQSQAPPEAANSFQK